MRNRLVPAGVLILLAAVAVLVVRNRLRSKSVPPVANPATEQQTLSPVKSGSSPSSVPSQKQLAEDLIRLGVTPERATQYFQHGNWPTARRTDAHRRARPVRFRRHPRNTADL
jgi:Flp pilus assembly protein CpaB